GGVAGVGIAVRRGGVGGGVGDEVPLVHHDNDRPAGLVGVAADVGVEGGDAFGGVEDEERDVGGFEVLAGHDHRQLLGHELGLALAADAGGVDEAEVVAGAGDDLVYSIPSCTGYRADDGAGGSGEGVEQGGFADVGAADDGDAGFVGLQGAVGAEQPRLLRFAVRGSRFEGRQIRRFWLRQNDGRLGSDGALRGGRGEGGEDLVEQVADAGAVLGGDGEDVGEAEAAEVFRGGGESGGVDFVDGEEDGLAAAEGEAGSVRPSITMIIAFASLRATWAWRKISAGMRSGESGTMPPVSTRRAWWD